MIATEATPILGPSLVTHHQAVEAFLALGATLNGYTRADLNLIFKEYARTCAASGVSFGVCVGQVAKETGWLSSWWSARPRRNPAGIGVTGSTYVAKPAVPAVFRESTGRWVAGNTFASWGEAVEAHVGRLLGYLFPTRPVSAMTPEQLRLVAVATAVRPFGPRVRGCAASLRDLGQVDNQRGVGWAVPGEGYGASVASKIVRIGGFA